MLSSLYVFVRLSSNLMALFVSVLVLCCETTQKYIIKYVFFDLKDHRTRKILQGLNIVNKYEHMSTNICC